MMLGMTNGRNETLTTNDIANAFINPPINKDAVILVWCQICWPERELLRREQCGRSEAQYMG
eukprot:12903830-Prorocentrum_lima.AAC.1